jgi:hypothetical protein
MKMKRRIAVTMAGAALLLVALAASAPTDAPPFSGGGIADAQAAVTKSLAPGGGGGDVSGVGDRFGGLLSKVGAPIVIAVAGYFLLGSLASRNIGAGVGVVLVTLVSLIFLVSPQSIEALAKGIANTVF